jgi:hypothetical protein
VPVLHDTNPRTGQRVLDHPITWPFDVWGLDLLGPSRKASGGLTHLLVTVDKFIKWIEARSLAKIGSKQAVSFA